MQSIRKKLKKSGKASHLIPYLVIAISACLLSYSLWCGIGLTFDSMNYLASARSFDATFQLINANGKPNTFQAPLFAIFLSLFDNHVMDFIRIINIAFFLVTMIIVFNILKTLVKDVLLTSIAIAMISLAVGSQMIYNFVWSEPLFLLFLAAHNLFLIKYLKTGRLTHLLLTATMAFLMCITRNAGIFILFATLIGLIIIPQHPGGKAALLYGLFGVSGFVAWNSYTFVVLKGTKSFLEGLIFFSDQVAPLTSYLDTLLAWFLPGFIPFYIRLALVLIAIFMIFYKLKAGILRPETRIFIIQSVVYVFFILAFFRMYESDAERFFAIIFPWVMIGIFSTIENINRHLIVRKIILIALIGCLPYMVARSVKNSIFWHKSHCSATSTGIFPPRIDYHAQ